MLGISSLSSLCGSEKILVHQSLNLLITQRLIVPVSVNHTYKLMLFYWEPGKDVILLVK